MSALAWGALAKGGIFAIIIGLVAVLGPVTLRVDGGAVGCYAFIGGIFTVRRRGCGPAIRLGLRWPTVLQGVLGILVGVLVFIRRGPPSWTAYLIAAWAIIWACSG